MGWFSSAYEKHLSEENNRLEHELKMKKAYIEHLEAALNPCNNHGHRTRSRFSENSRDDILFDELRTTKMKLCEAERALEMRAYNNDAQRKVCEANEKIRRLEDINIKLNKDLSSLRDNIYKLKSDAEIYTPACIKAKNREIETLKELLKFSGEDEKEWDDHKEMFSFMKQKRDVLEEKLNKWILEATRYKETVETLEKELQMYKDFFKGNEVKIFVKDKEVELSEVIKGD